MDTRLQAHYPQKFKPLVFEKSTAN